ncbi:MAG TPA: hypothetical protein VIS74_05870 [Chthoniobacterales bacterium]
MPKEENVLVIKRSLFEELGAFQGFCAEAPRYLEKFLKRENNYFLPRSRAEEDPTHKQLIPYVVFTHANRILRYVRGAKSGEKRLVAKGSIGIGGHINDEDEGLFAFDDQAYAEAVKREISEELRLPGGWTLRLAGLINDDGNEVGRVHLGVVHVCELPSGEVGAGEKAIAKLEFLTADELRAEEDALETWSQIVFRNWPVISAN